jgi:hypothetical protein
MPGDALIPDGTEMSMQAVTVDARPEDIWPWLVQIGYRRRLSRSPWNLR